MTQNNLKSCIQATSYRSDEDKYRDRCYSDSDASCLSRLRDYCKIRNIKASNWHRLARNIELDRKGLEHNIDRTSIIDIVIQEQSLQSQLIVGKLQLEIEDLQIRCYPDPLPMGIGNYEVVDENDNLLGCIYTIKCRWTEHVEYRTSKVKNSSKLRNREFEDNISVYTDIYSAALGFVDANIVEEVKLQIADLITDETAIKTFDMIIERN
jgi:hypothetical protein